MVIRYHDPRESGFQKNPYLQELFPLQLNLLMSPQLIARRFLVARSFATSLLDDFLVRIPTVTYDKMGLLGEDPRWDTHFDLSDYLSKTFPCLYETLEVDDLNEHALLYLWNGLDLKLKLLLFMAHRDVVPAPDSTLDRWTHPPFSGHYDGDYIWGRGSEDDKSNLIAILSAIDYLLHDGFKPKRRVVFAVGFDEEGGASVQYGAKRLAEELPEKHGDNGIEVIFDEGIAGIENNFGTEFPLPATAEKGYVDVSVTVDTAGGHSSIPPDHTAIGYLAQIITNIEQNPFRSQLTLKNRTSVYLKFAALFAKVMPV